MKSKASAAWKGGLKGGKGRVSLAGGALSEAPYDFVRRFEGGAKGTTPEELIAGAHAACFAMATSAQLESAGHAPDLLEVEATVELRSVEGKPTVVGSHLELAATVPGIDATRFRELAEAARKGCVISRLLDTEITLTAELRDSGRS